MNKSVLIVNDIKQPSDFLPLIFCLLRIECPYESLPLGGLSFGI